ncbi:hypothetical protein Tco_0136084, partial [Tanacetum coccineum]
MSQHAGAGGDASALFECLVCGKKVWVPITHSVCPGCNADGSVNCIDENEIDTMWRLPQSPLSWGPDYFLRTVFPHDSPRTPPSSSRGTLASLDHSSGTPGRTRNHNNNGRGV